MMGFRMSWLLNVIILSFTFNYPSEAKKKLPSALVVGTVYCDTCFQKDFSKTSHFISGALVVVECGDTNSKPSFRKEVKTNKHGEFKVHLPFSVSKHVKKIKGCAVKLISSSEAYCAVASTATSSSLHLKSRKTGTHIFSAGFFTFKPLTQPNLCNQKPSIQNSKKLNSVKSLISNPNDSAYPPMPILRPIDNSRQFAPIPILPRLPPLPELPPLPTTPGLPFLPPVPKKTTPVADSSNTPSDQEVLNEKIFGFPFPPIPFLPPPSILPPNPLLPPPSILPPNPLMPPPSIIPPILPSPPPSLFPPIFPSPPPSLFPPIFPSPPSPPSLFPPILPLPPGFNFPPVPGLPGLTPPPSPPPPVFPIPLPPFPFQPPPGFPGIPPAASSSLSKAANP